MDGRLGDVTRECRHEVLQGLKAHHVQPKRLSQGGGPVVQGLQPAHHILLSVAFHCLASPGVLGAVVISASHRCAQHRLPARGGGCRVLHRTARQPPSGRTGVAGEGYQRGRCEEIAHLVLDRALCFSTQVKKGKFSIQMTADALQLSTDELQAVRGNASERPEIQSSLRGRFGFHTRVTDDSPDDGVWTPARAVPLIVFTDRPSRSYFGTFAFSESPHQITS